MKNDWKSKIIFAIQFVINELFAFELWLEVSAYVNEIISIIVLVTLLALGYALTVKFENEK
ncbi:hypothetical protein [Lactobacillus sp. PSON]|uniref:hypothetical protein n=1 Tax=Lactobacillus sp. PSON TaxID=3455454 RepID=UPI004042AA06